jgi:hypothetical protein
LNNEIESGDGQISMLRQYVNHSIDDTERMCPFIFICRFRKRSDSTHCPYDVNPVFGMMCSKKIKPADKSQIHAAGLRIYFFAISFPISDA